MEKSQSCISISGLNFEQINQSFNQIFKKVTTNLDSLTLKLEKDVIPKYNALGEEIKAMFNQEFATKMNDLCTDMTGPTGVVSDRPFYNNVNTNNFGDLLHQNHTNIDPTMIDGPWAKESCEAFVRANHNSPGYGLYDSTNYITGKNS